LKLGFKTILIAFLFVLVVPLTVSAAPAFVNLSVDRTTIAHGESVTFTIRATPQTNFVFATVGGIQTQGSRITGNEWTLTVLPTQTGTVSVFANNTNNQNNAAIMNVPITVSGTGVGANVTTPTHNVTIPAPPANLGPVEIASVTETPATQARFVQLTVVTSPQASYVWANFDRVNNVRATGRFALGTMVSQTATARTWVINFDPATWAAQTVEIGSNRTYAWGGAATQQFNVTLSQPFVAPVAPRINSASPNPRTVNRGRSTTITIATNLDTEHVWIRDADNREFTAHRTTTTATARNWSVTFTPERSGSVTIFANNTRTEVGAARRNETINVSGTSAWGDGDAQIIGSPTATLVRHDDIRINVTTNNLTEVVWATLPGNRRVQLQRTNSGTGNRTWEVETWDDGRSGSITISVSSIRGNINNLAADDTRTINRGGTSWWDDDEDWGSGYIRSVEHWGSRSVRRGSRVGFRIFTSEDVDDLEIRGSHMWVLDIYRVGGVRNGRQEWFAEVEVRDSAPNTLHLTLEAFRRGIRVDTRSMPSTTITN